MRKWMLGSCGLVFTGAFACGQHVEAGEARILDAPIIRTVYIKISKPDDISRAKAVREALIKEINMRTPYRVVGSPDDADVILEAGIKSLARTMRSAP
jgi:hypothetical protein